MIEHREGAFVLHVIGTVGGLEENGLRLHKWYGGRLLGCVGVGAEWHSPHAGWAVADALEDDLSLQGDDDRISGEGCGAAMVGEHWDRHECMGKGFKDVGLGGGCCRARDINVACVG